eukprot:7529827-Pyramimonas_sp.AAC.1
MNEITEECCIYDMSAHPSTTSRAPAAGPDAPAPTGDSRSTQPPTGQPRGASAGGVTFSYSLPDLPPLAAPSPPAHSTHRLAGAESRGPVRALVNT